MKLILKPLFELITGEITILDNIIVNYILLSIIGLIAFKVSWDSVGWLYKIGLIDGRMVGSIIHWIIRLIIFVGICVLFSALLWLYQLIISIPLWIWLIVIGLIFAIIIIVHLIKKKQSG